MTITDPSAEQAALATIEKYHAIDTSQLELRQLDRGTGNNFGEFIVYEVSQTTSNGEKIARVTVNSFLSLGWQQTSYSNLQHDTIDQRNQP
ncbi:hypothetical protein [Persicirhabdus sediminis]|uniref:Uncharacterized protein n=1 Tax=Persicirhabdus sediminis TaxID=454144 RepID=A0A8J7MC54_9BACT|nr:hypothetical protein [Persicirhabdus sediminis]MBK1790407.1 hypothetical protein [Persicirhabdus sediminis]